MVPTMQTRTSTSTSNVTTIAEGFSQQPTVSSTVGPTSVETTLAPTLVTPGPRSTPTEEAPIAVIPATSGPLTNEQRWRAQQLDREVFDPRRIYVATDPVQLMWFDPLTGQSLEVGTVLGEFTTQAQFVFRPRNVSALEVPYRINQDFGLTAISPAVKQRMTNAGYTESVETYIIQTERVQPKE
jgi:hypothetical protein